MLLFCFIAFFLFGLFGVDGFLLLRLGCMEMRDTNLDTSACPAYILKRFLLHPLFPELEVWTWESTNEGTLLAE